MEFTCNGTRYRLTKQEVEQRMRDVMPDPRLVYTANVNGIEYPPKQVFATALDIDRASFTTQRAYGILLRLGFGLTAH